MAAYPSAIAALDALGSQLVDAMKPSPAYQTYQKVAPRPEDFPRLLDKLGASSRKSYDWTDEIERLPPLLFVGADADYFRPSHVVDVYAKLGGGLNDPMWDGSGGRSASQLAILPGTSHYDILSSPVLLPVVESWLATP